MWVYICECWRGRIGSRRGTNTVAEEEEEESGDGSDKKKAVGESGTQA